MDGISKQRRMWLSCPRCVSGDMYLDQDGEYVCLQCGFHGNIDTLYKNTAPAQPV